MPCAPSGPRASSARQTTRRLRPWACVAMATSRCRATPNVALLERIVADQRDILSKVRGPDLTKIPQVWALYKEVQEYYEKGMRVARRCDLAVVRRQLGQYPSPANRRGEEAVGWRRRVLPPRLRWRAAQLQMAQHRACGEGVGADAPRVGVRCDSNLDSERRRHQAGGTAPPVLPGLCLEPEGRGSRRNACAHTRSRGPSSSSVASMPWRLPTCWRSTRRSTAGANRRCSIRAPTVSSTTGKPRRSWPTTTTCRRAREALYATLPPAARDAFFQLVLYPIKACATVNEMYFTVGLNRPLCGARAAIDKRPGGPRARALPEGRSAQPRVQRETGRRKVGAHDGPDADRLHLLAAASAERDARCSGGPGAGCGGDGRVGGRLGRQLAGWWSGRSDRASVERLRQGTTLHRDLQPWPTTVRLHDRTFEPVARCRSWRAARSNAIDASWSRRGGLMSRSTRHRRR